MPVAANFALQIVGDDNLVARNLVAGSPTLAVYNDGSGNHYECNRVVNNDFGFLFDAQAGAGTPNSVIDNTIFGNGAGVDATVVAAPPAIGSLCASPTSFARAAAPE